MAFDKDDFFDAVQHDDLLRVALYTHAGANLNVKNVLGQTALHIAVEKGYLDMIEQLMDNGADPYINNVYNDNCLTMAIRVHPDTHVVEKLLELGTDPNVENGMGFLPIQYAIMYGKLDHMKVLIKYSADLFKVSTSGKSAFDLLTNPDSVSYDSMMDEFLEQADLHAQNQDGNTLLHQLIIAGVPRVYVHKILKRRANPNIQNNDGNTAFHLAVLDAHSRSYIPILLGFGANPYLRNNVGQNAFDILKTAQEFGLLALLRDYAKRHDLKRKFNVHGGAS